MPLRAAASLLAFCLCAAAACPAVAEDASPLRALATGAEARGWEAVGRLDLGRGSFCTGTLIAEDLVLTAAHCLYDAATGGVIAPEKIRFLAGWRNGRAVAYRGARRAMIDPSYKGLAGETADRVARIGADLGLVELDRPLRLPQVPPFAIGAPPATGERVGVVSYARDRAEDPSLQSTCEVLLRERGALLLTCAADFGASGAPVFAPGPGGGAPQIVSIISAKAEKDDRPVSLGATLTDLAQLRAAMDARRLAPEPMESRAGGAKFLRP